MSRTFYRWLLWLHPPAFRREFATEMLWIFEETAPSGAAPLFADGLLSLLRQWTLRAGAWKLAVALFGGALQIMIGGFGALTVIHSRVSSHRHFVQLTPSGTPAETLASQEMMHVALWAVAAVLAIVAAMVLWVGNLNSKRLQRLSAGVPKR